MQHADPAPGCDGQALTPTMLLAGAHATALIGWGTEDGVDYWLLQNSWGEQNGIEGIWKMRRGTDECNLESWLICRAFAPLGSDFGYSDWGILAQMVLTSLYPTHIMLPLILLPTEPTVLTPL
eukprot:263360-Rhodomonas_salina.3